MIKKRLVIICILFSVVGIGCSQTKKVKVQSSDLKNSREEFYVLKSDNTIKEGSYKRIVNDKLMIEGAYANGQKSGVWKIYDYFNNVEMEINYDSGDIEYSVPDSVTRSYFKIKSKIVPDNDRPVLNITGSGLFMGYLFQLIEYPHPEANVSGIVVVKIKINPKGEIVDYVIKKSAVKYLDDEALRVVKLVPFEFLPEYKNGKPVDSEVLIPINFRYQ